MTRPDLDALLVVQDLDLAIDQCDHRRRHLPEQTELESIDTEAQGLKRRLESVTGSRDEVATRQQAAESELAAAEERIREVSKRLYGGEVSASRELQAMAADIESLQARVSAFEDQVLELLEEREPLDAELDQLMHRVRELASGRRDAVARMEVAAAAIDAEIAGLTEQRAQAAVAVSAELLRTYDGLRRRLGGVGAARLVGNHCDGCHLVLSAVELDHIRHLGDGEIATCEQCSRILVPVSSAF